MTIRPRAHQDLDTLIDPHLARRSAQWSERVSRFAAERQMYMSTLRRGTGAFPPLGDESGENVLLDQIYASDTVRLKVATGTYGQIVRTSDSLVHEFALFGYLLGRSAFRGRHSAIEIRPQRLLGLLPWRREIHRWNPGAALLLSPDKRASGLGVAMTLVQNVAGRRTALVARRSSSVGTYPDVLHVFPAGMMNTRSDHRLNAEESLTALPRLNMLAEFLEECFDLEEFSGRSISSVSTKVAEAMHARGLDRLEPRFTGIAIDLLNLRTEICAVLDLSDHATGASDFQMSWEFEMHDSIQSVELDSGSTWRRQDFVQAGLGALHLAQRQAPDAGHDPPGPDRTHDGH